MIRPSTPTLALILVSLAVGSAISQTSPAPSPSERPASLDAPVPIILDAPGSLDALWDRLRSPDFVLMRGDRYRELLKAGRGDAPKSDAIVEAVAVRGVVDRHVAELELDIRVASAATGDAWVPIRLDGQVLSSAVEEGRIVPIRAGSSGGWEAEINGAGRHVLRFGLTTRVSANGEERRLELPIPLAASTSIGVVVRDDPVEVTLGPGEGLIPVRLPAGAGVRVGAILRPRTRLDMRWRIAKEPSRDEPPLLGVQGDVALDITPDAVRSRTRWSIASLRGVTSSISIAVDPEEELIEVEMDGHVVPVDRAGRQEQRSLKIPLPEPFRPGSSPHSVTLLTRRKIDEGPATSLRIRGSIVADGSLQGGAVAVSQTGPIWIEAIPVRGLQRMDPANDLPSILRSRPGTVLAFRIVDRHFELNLHVQPSPVLIQARTDAIMVLRPGALSAEVRLAFRTTPGRVFEVIFPAIDGEEIETPPPDDSVASSQWTTVEGSKRGAAGASRLLSVRLTPAARESGDFTLTLKTRRSLPESDGRIEGRLPVPLEATSLGGQVAIVRAPGVQARLAEGLRPGSARALSRIEPPKQANWPWAVDRYSDLDPAPLWLSFEGQPPALPLAISLQNTSYHCETVLVSEVTRTGVTYRSSNRLEVIGGLLDEFELLVPEGVEPDWSIEGIEIASRYPQGVDANGHTRHRVILTRKGARQIAFGLRYSTRFEPPLSDSPRAGRLAWIRPAPEAEGPFRLICRSSPGVTINVDHAGWEESPQDPSDDSRRAPIRLSRSVSPATLPEFRATAEPIFSLPQVVVSRAYLRSVQGSDEIRTTATFAIESHGSSVLIGVPQGSRWVEARLDGEHVADLERPGPDQYRIVMPAGESKGPRVLQVELAYPARRRASWQPPEIVGAEVQTSYWAVVVPMSHAVLGTPGRWSDENGWRWRDYVWMKTPLRDEAELARWVSGESYGSADQADERPLQRSHQHEFLFRKLDGLAPIDPVILPRSILVVICSGVVSAIGLGLVLAAPSRMPFVASGLAIAGLLAATWDTALTLQLLPCGALGLVLTLVAAALQWVVTRRRKAAAARFSNSVGASAPSVANHVPAVGDDGSDEPTAIRPRPTAVVEAFARPPVGSPDATPSLSEMGAQP